MRALGTALNETKLKEIQTSTTAYTELRKFFDQIRKNHYKTALEPYADAKKKPIEGAIQSFAAFQNIAVRIIPVKKDVKFSNNATSKSSSSSSKSGAKSSSPSSGSPTTPTTKPKVSVTQSKLMLQHQRHMLTVPTLEMPKVDGISL